MYYKIANILAFVAGIALVIWAVTTPGEQLLVSGIGGGLFGWNVIKLVAD